MIVWIVIYTTSDRLRQAVQSQVITSGNTEKSRSPATSRPEIIRVLGSTRSNHIAFRVDDFYCFHASGTGTPSAMIPGHATTKQVATNLHGRTVAARIRHTMRV